MLVFESAKFFFTEDSFSPSWLLYFLSLNLKTEVADDIQRSALVAGAAEMNKQELLSSQELPAIGVTFSLICACLY